MQRDAVDQALQAFKFTTRMPWVEPGAGSGILSIQLLHGTHSWVHDGVVEPYTMLGLQPGATRSHGKSSYRRANRMDRGWSPPIPCPEQGRWTREGPGDVKLVYSAGELLSPRP